MNTSFWTLLALGIVLTIAAIAAKAIQFFTAEPKVTVDYLAEYNKISKPDGFDPNDNADELYTKAYEVYVRPSEPAINVLDRWYEDINKTEKAALQEWLGKNAECMKYLEEGNKKKFFWAELDMRVDAWEQEDSKAKEDGKNNDIMSWTISMGARLFEYRARVAATDGHFDEAITALMECWKIGEHYSNPKLLLGVRGGLSTKERAIEMALRILDSSKLDVNDLRLWQESWQKAFDKDKYRPGFKTDRLIWYGYIQKNFAYHPKGKGRLAWKKAKEFDHFDDCSYIGKDGKIHEVWKRAGINPRYCCLWGPTSNEVKGLIDYICEHYEKYGDETPWFWYHSEQKFQREIEEWKVKHPLPKMMYIIPDLSRVWLPYHRLKAKSDALITVIALLRFKADHGHYPKNLEMLMPRDGFRYLEKMPQDPFSKGPLVYHWLVDNFELYSVGPDFNDDGGKRTYDNYPFSGDNKGDDVFWPPFRLNRENIKFMPSKDRPEP